VRALLAEAAVEAELDPDRLSLSEGLFELTEMLSLALTVELEEAAVRLRARLRHKMARHVLPPRRLRINRRESSTFTISTNPRSVGCLHLSRSSRRSSSSILSSCLIRLIRSHLRFLWAVLK